MPTKLMRATVGLCCILGLPARSPAQRAAPTGVVAPSVETSTREGQPLSGVSAQSALFPPRPSTPTGSATVSRRAHAGYGALLGAAIGGTFGFIVARTDHTGEGLVTPVMTAGGAALGAVVGALIGTLLPVHLAPAT